jgi:hypothetical protein
MIDVVKMICRQDLVPNFMNRLVLASAASLPLLSKKASLMAAGAATWD